MITYISQYLKVTQHTEHSHILDTVFLNHCIKHSMPKNSTPFSMTISARDPILSFARQRMDTLMRILLVASAIQRQLIILQACKLSKIFLEIIAGKVDICD